MYTKIIKAQRRPEMSMKKHYRNYMKRASSNFTRGAV